MLVSLAPPPAPHSLSHHRSLTRLPGPRPADRAPALEDRESVQVALSVVVNALATGKLDTRRATALLYGLQLASHNATSLNTKPYAPKIVRDVESTPDGLDLAQSGATLEIADNHDHKADLDLDDDEEDENEDD